MRHGRYLYRKTTNFQHTSTDLKSKYNFSLCHLKPIIMAIVPYEIQFLLIDIFCGLCAPHQRSTVTIYRLAIVQHGSRVS